MNGVLTAANIIFRSIGGNFTNFYRSASSVDRVSQEIYSQQAFYIYYTSGVPIVPSFLDFGRKRSGFGPVLATSGDASSNTRYFRDFPTP
jgi:hypothetical protein